MENRRLILAIALVLFVWSGFNLLFPTASKNQTPQTQGEQPQQNIKLPEPTPPESISTPVTVVNHIYEERRITVSSDLYKMVFTTSGARLVDVELLKFKQTNTENSSFVKIIDSSTNEFGSYSISGGEGLFIPNDLNYSFPSDKNEVFISQTEKTDIIFQGITSENIRVTKIFTFYPNKYDFDVNLILENLSTTYKKGTLNLAIVNKWDESKISDRYHFIGSISFNGEDLLEDKPDDLKEAAKIYGKDTQWTSYSTKYFADIVKPFDDAINTVTVSYKNNAVYNIISSMFLNLDPNGKQVLKYKGYIGPRDYDKLKASNLSLERIIDLGFFGIIAKPLMVGLKFFYGFLGNFGFAIILLTVCIKALFWPLTQKSYSSMKDMQKLQPQMQKLRTKHGKDKQKLNQEMMALYKENRVNPFGGCLPMLIQIPVFFALYQVLLGAIELRHAPFMLWITDLSAADTLISDALGLGFALGPLPIIMGFTMFLQQKMSPTNMDPMQAKIMMYMPVFFTFIFLSFPSGLVIYWLVNNILTIAQQYLINRKPA